MLLLQCKSNSTYSIVISITQKVSTSNDGNSNGKLAQFMARTKLNNRCSLYP